MSVDPASPPPVSARQILDHLRQRIFLVQGNIEHLFAAAIAELQTCDGDPATCIQLSLVALAGETIQALRDLRHQLSRGQDRLAGDEEKAAKGGDNDA